LKKKNNTFVHFVKKTKKSNQVFCSFFFSLLFFFSRLRHELLPGLCRKDVVHDGANNAAFGGNFFFFLFGGAKSKELSAFLSHTPQIKINE